MLLNFNSASDVGDMPKPRSSSSDKGIKCSMICNQKRGQGRRFALVSRGIAGRRTRFLPSCHHFLAAQSPSPPHSRRIPFWRSSKPMSSSPAATVHMLAMVEEKRSPPPQRHHLPPSPPPLEPYNSDCDSARVSFVPRPLPPPPVHSQCLAHSSNGI